MKKLIPILAAKNIQVALINETLLDVTAPDDLWNQGLENHLREHKQEIINELRQSNSLSIPNQKEIAEHQGIATTATNAKNQISIDSSKATTRLQLATAAAGRTDMQLTLKLFGPRARLIKGGET